MTSKEMRTTIDTLAAAHSAAQENSNNPHETARVFVRAVGAEEAAQCVAAMIRRASWDGRISREAKAWAQSVALSGEWERHIEDTYCDAIHPAHLSQIAEAMQKELEGCSAEEKEPQEAAQETAPGAKRPKALKKSQAAAAKRIIKTAVKYSGKEALHGAWIDGNGMQCVCSNYHGARLRDALPDLPEIPDHLEPVNFSRLYPLDRVDTELMVPSAAELRAYIRDCKALGKKALWDFGEGLPLVNAAYLLDMVALLPGSTATCQAGHPCTPIYFSGPAGDGLLCPVRKA